MALPVHTFTPGKTVFTNEFGIRFGSMKFYERSFKYFYKL